ncbi:MAG: TatD family hydrolase [Rhodospirillaceae bacterium]
MYVDSHCHLDFESFDEDREECIARALGQGVGTMLTISTHLSRLPQVLELTRLSERIFCSIGIHPHHVTEEEKTTSEVLETLSQHDRVVGIGETGLDYYYNNSPAEQQRESFIKHIKASRNTGLPLIVHTREADQDMSQILREEMKKGQFPCVLHCFSSGRDLAKTALELGCYISISGIVTFKSATDLQQLIKELPVDRLLIETDSPFLAPVPNRGKRNEPAYVVQTAKKISELMGVSLELIAEKTTSNFFSLFAKAKR